MVTYPFGYLPDFPKRDLEPRLSIPCDNAKGPVLPGPESNLGKVKNDD